MPDHAQSLDSESERKPADFVGVVADASQHVRVDHSGSAEFDPLAVPIVIRFDARFGEREERRADANWNFITQVVRGEQFQNGL